MLAQRAQGFELSTPVRARWIKLSILSNYGANYTELTEVQIIGAPASDRS